MPLHGKAANLCHSKLASPPQSRVTVPIVLHPALFRDSRQDAPVGVCLATSGAGNSRKLSQAARDYAAGVRKGIDEDDLVALQLGKARAEELSIVQQKYKDKLKQRLIEEAELQRREQAAKSKQFSLGKLAYGKGLYSESARLFEVALDKEGPFSKLGGEIQLWQALAYQACGREQDCIEVYKTVEQTHPVTAIKKQAAELRFIMEAPKLQLRPEERISLPLLDNLDRYKSDKSGVRPRLPPMKQKSNYKKTWEDEFLENYKAPALLSNKYVWVASIVVGAGLAVYSATLR
ncbi:MAG: ATP-dependent protease Clp ATPase subunit [Trebouxia sp. A1-2]|nr:MAG: ATP-dependent protease Clp ATPase subunit [Trebouxia sp. A1-2]